MPVWVDGFFLPCYAYYDNEMIDLGGKFARGHEIIYHRNRNKNRKESRRRNKQKREQEDRRELQKKTGLPDTSIIWHRVKYAPHELYPAIPWVKDNPTRSPEPHEIAEAFDAIQSYRFLHSGLNVIRDPLQENEIIAIIEFTPFEKLTPAEKDDLNFLSTFLHDSKQFISVVDSCSRVWGGLMWAIGWRKSYDRNQMFGRYIKQFTKDKAKAFHSHYLKSPRVGEIIGNLFKKLAHEPFQKNHDLMEKYKLPSLADLSYGQPPEDSTCSPHITFTTDGFFNPPHIDSEDISQFAFVLFLPTRSSDGTLVDGGEYDVTSGPFLFPDHKFGIDFDHQHGIVKMIWQANKYTHCTMPHSLSEHFCRLGMSVQINASLTAACNRYHTGFYTKAAHYFGDHFRYLFRSLGKKCTPANLASLLFSFTLFLFLL